MRFCESVGSRSGLTWNGRLDGWVGFYLKRRARPSHLLRFRIHGAPSDKGCRSIYRTERKTLNKTHHASKEIGPGTSTARKLPREAAKL
eukprot:3399503-Amphidinium_carterae.1